MASVDYDKRKVSFEWVKKFGMKWAVLTALVVDLEGRGVRVPSEVNQQLKLARTKILSGSFWPCEVGCALAKLEGQLISIASSLGEDYLRPWFDLLGQAVEGRIDPKEISGIPALACVANDCTRLASRCGEPASLPEFRRPETGGGCS